MIAGCPTCGARYRIDPARLGSEGARLRCTRCETVFRVRPPATSPEAEAPRPARRDAATPASQPPAAPEAPPEAPPDREKLVLIAHPEPASAKTLADAVASWGLAPLLVHDGVEAILSIQRTLPRIVVLDAALPKMFGFQICELMKRNEQLRSIQVILIGEIHDQDRYRRPPGDLYGADAYIERHELPEGLPKLLSRFGLPISGGDAGARTATPAPPPPTPAPAEVPSAPARGVSAAPPPAPAAASAAATADPEVAKGERLARIIVSDVVLYNQEKFDAAVRAGNVVEAFVSELEEGYALFAQRVDTNTCDPREFIHRELLRVARSRGPG